MVSVNPAKDVPVLYFANPCSESVVQAMLQGQLGMIDTPRQRNIKPDGVVWCADNGCFGKHYPGDEAWMEWLSTRQGLGLCAFATAPDVVGDARETLERSAPHLPAIRELGVRAALVAQDGLEDLEVPWDDFDALFIGGTTDWKLGEAAREIALEARRRGKWLHMGRVNSRKRMRYAAGLGCDSVDGTYLTYGPDMNLPKLLRWMSQVLSERAPPE